MAGQYKLYTFHRKLFLLLFKWLFSAFVFDVNFVKCLLAVGAAAALTKC